MRMGIIPLVSGEPSKVPNDLSPRSIPFFLERASLPPSFTSHLHRSIKCLLLELPVFALKQRITPTYVTQPPCLKQIKSSQP